MKSISSRDVEAYIYSAIILPLKKLNVDYFSMPTPLIDTQGCQTKLSVEEMPLPGQFRHRYQREQARRKAPLLLMMQVGRKRAVIGEYDAHTHAVKLFAKQFEASQFGKYLMGKVEQQLSRSYPFTSVRLFSDRPDNAPVPQAAMNMVSDNSYDLDADDGEDISELPF